MNRTKRVILGVLVVAALACVDSSGSTGTNTGVPGTNTDPTDLSGGWNATLYTFTSTANSATTTDLITSGFTVALTITNGGHFTLTTSGGSFLSPVTNVGDMLVTGSDVKMSTGTTVLATGTVSRNNNTMTLDITGVMVVWDFDHDGVRDPATLHAKFVQG